MNWVSLPATLAALMSLSVPAANAVIITTNMGNGADAEVRESNPDQNRGTSTELATRAADRYESGSPNDGSDRNSAFYLQFDLSGLVSGDAAGAVLRLTYRNNNLTESRVSDMDMLPPDYGMNGIEFYGIAGASFNENTITYANAPGITPDGDVGTKDFDASATLLGDVDLPSPGGVTHLFVGDALDFMAAGLDAFLEQEILNNPAGVAVIVGVHRNSGMTFDSGFAGQQKFGDEPSNWINFNYLFNPKEQTTLNTDMISPWSGADNSNGAFSPQLILDGRATVSTPATLTLFGLGLLGLASTRRCKG